jgi:hypothetical protein
VGYVSESYPSRGETIFKTNGRKKAINTVAELCIPIVLENKSIESPSKNPSTSKSHFGVSKGRISMNKIYT